MTFSKIQEGLSPEVYDAIVTTANQVKISFGGHVPNDVGVLRAIKARQTSIDHLDNYLEAHEADNSPASTPTRRPALGILRCTSMSARYQPLSKPCVKPEFGTFP